MRRIVLCSAVLAVLFLAAFVIAGWARPAAGGPWIHDQQAAVAQLLALGYPVYCGGNTGAAVALTFDDGPGLWTGRTLDVLDRYGARATFFDLGSHVIRYPGLTRREAREGVVGDHSWSHPVLTALSTGAIFQELFQTKQAILRRAGQPPAWLFRPPYGASDSRVDALSRTLGMLTVLWELTPDIGATDPAAIASQVYADARPGSIILLHENNHQGVTAAALGPILSWLATKGLKAVTLPELFAIDPPSERQLHTGPYGCGPLVTGVDPTEGPSSGGTLVTISGARLNLPQHVYFGTQLATSVTGTPDGKVQAVAPPGSGTVDVTVTTHFDSSPTSPLDHYSYR